MSPISATATSTPRERAFYVIPRKVGEARFGERWLEEHGAVRSLRPRGAGGCWSNRDGDDHLFGVQLESSSRRTPSGARVSYELLASTAAAPGPLLLIQARGGRVERYSGPRPGRRGLLFTWTGSIHELEPTAARLLQDSSLRGRVEVVKVDGRQPLPALLMDGGVDVDGEVARWLVPNTYGALNLELAGKAAAKLAEALSMCKEAGIPVTSSSVFSRLALRRRFSVMLPIDAAYLATGGELLGELPADDEVMYPGANEPDRQGDAHAIPEVGW